MVRRLVQCLLTVLILVAAWSGLQLLRADRLFHQAPSVEVALGALQLDPGNPDFLYLLGMAYREQVDLWDPDRSIEYLEGAVRQNPYNWRYQLELARAQEVGGHSAVAETAYRQALSLNPRDAVYLWRFGNFLIRRQRSDEAVPYLVEAVRNDPEMGPACLKLFWKLGLDMDTIAEGWPQGRSFDLQLLASLSEREEAAALERAGAVWIALQTQPEPLTPEEAAPYLEALMRRGSYPQLRQEWSRVMRRLGYVDPDFTAGRNLVWWGGFDRLFPTGMLGWHLQASPSFQWESIPREGSDGPAGVKLHFQQYEGYFSGLRQRLVIPRPGRLQMTLTAKSQGLTTEQGIYLELLDVAQGKVIARTEQIRGSTEWASYTRLFRLPAIPAYLELRVRRDPSRKIDSALNGWAWIDSVWVEYADVDEATGPVAAASGN